MPEPHTHPVEQEALTAGARLRWAIVCVGAVILWIGRSLGHTDLPAWIIFCYAATGVVVNLTLIWLMRSGWHRHWLHYAICAADVMLLGLAVLYLGPGGSIAAFFLITIPCASRAPRALGIFALVWASATYVVAALANRIITESPTAPAILLDLLIFIAVSATVLATHGHLFRRIVAIRRMISGAGPARIQTAVDGVANDHVGQLARSLRDLLQRTCSTGETVRQSANEFVQIAQSLSSTIREASASSARVATMADQLATGLQHLSSTAETGITECENSALEAHNLESRAEVSLGSIREFEGTAAVGRDRIADAIQAVIAIKADIDRAAGKVEELGGLARQIAAAAISIAKIARHTHVLALNAAIEAARAEEHGDEFAVVADHVRTLAGEAGRSARDVGDLVNEVNARVVAAASALAASDEKIAEIGQIARETREALTGLRFGALQVADFVSSTAEISQAQVDHARSFAGRMSHMASASAGWSAEIQEASAILSDQLLLMTDLERVIERLERNVDTLERGIAQLTSAGP